MTEGKAPTPEPVARRAFADNMTEQDEQALLRACKAAKAPTEAELDGTELAIDRALTELADVCSQGPARRFRMSIPARPDDTDLIIHHALTQALRCIRALRAVPAELIAEAEALLNDPKLTAGPWTSRLQPGQTINHTYSHEVISAGVPSGIVHTQKKANADFIAWCRTGVPKLLAAWGRKE